MCVCVCERERERELLNHHGARQAHAEAYQPMECTPKARRHLRWFLLWLRHFKWGNTTRKPLSRSILIRASHYHSHSHPPKRPCHPSNPRATTRTQSHCAICGTSSSPPASSPTPSSRPYSTAGTSKKATEGCTSTSPLEAGHCGITRDSPFSEDGGAANSPKLFFSSGERNPRWYRISIQQI